MAQPTLQAMLDYCAEITDTQEELILTSGSYTGDALILANKFINALNYAKDMIAKKRLSPLTEEVITLNGALEYDTTGLGQTLYKIEKITDSNSNDVTGFEQTTTNKIKLDSYSSASTISIRYRYIPPAFTISVLTASMDLPDRVDWHIPCYYAASEYFRMEGSTLDLTKRDYVLTLWNDGFNNLHDTLGSANQIKNVYGGFD